MRSYEVITEARKSFRLHPGLNPDDYQITGNLRDIEKWRCRVYVGDGTDKESQSHVGYVMISLKDDTIIPIARGDEHHRGMDLMYDFQNGEKNRYYSVKRIPGLIASDYLPIWAHGQNYIYTKDEAPDLLIALKKYLSYGGKDGLLTGSYEMDGKMSRLSTFVERDGNMEIEAGSLAPLGKKIYDDLKALSAAMLALPEDADRIQAKPVFAQAAKLLRDIPPTMVHGLGLDWEEFKAYPQKLRALQKENDYLELENMFFAYHGIKNKIHENMKNNRDNAYREREIRGIWGDVDLAIDMLSRF